MKTFACILAAGLLALPLAAVAQPPIADPPSLADLAARAQRVDDMDAVERLHDIYGYQQDKMLWSEQVDLFADHGSAAIFQNAEYKDKDGARRLWYGHWTKMTRDTLMQVDGVLNDHFQTQPVIDIAPDGKTARMRVRARDYVFTYAAPILAGQSNVDYSDHYVVNGKNQRAALLALLQDVIYENTFVKEGDVWKLKTFNLCIYASAPYERGYADRPIPGHMGAGPDEKPGERARVDLQEGAPEGAQELYPTAPMGPDIVHSPAETGCYVAKDQVMSRSAVFPFHYPNPITGQPVTWTNQ